MAAEAAGAGAGIGAVGALYEGQQQQQAFERAEAIAGNNATLALQEGDVNAQRVQNLTDQKIGAMQAGYGASGVSAASGSAMAVLAMSHSNAELDRQSVLNRAKVESINFQNQASQDEMGAKNAITASYFNALSGVLMGGARAYGYGSGTTSGGYGYGSAGGVPMEYDDMVG